VFALRRENWRPHKLRLRVARTLWVTVHGILVSFAVQAQVPSQIPAQAPPSAPAAVKGSAPEVSLPPLSASLTQFAGLQVSAIRYEGVDFDKSDKLTAELTQKAGEPLDPAKVRQTTRRLFATGRYRNIAVRVEPVGGEVTLVFSGIPRFYVGRITILGVKDDRLASLLQY